MLVDKSVKPAPGATGDGLLDFDQPVQQINFEVSRNSRDSQGFSCVKTINACWIVVRRGRGSSCSIPVFVRRVQPLRSVVNGGAS